MKLIKYTIITIALMLFVIESKTQCFTSFTDTTNGLTTTFTNTSTGTITNYLWRFGDGDTSTLQNPIHTYAYGNYYNVTLITSDSSCIDSITTLITVGCPIHADIVDSVISGNTHMFLNPLRGAQSSFTTYNWDFGDGNTSNLQFPTHTYAINGEYIVCLIKSDSSIGCSDTSCLFVDSSSTVCPINASITETISGLSAAFNVTSVSGLSGPASYSWEFGDRTIGTGQSITHNYTSQGLYRVVLIVADSNCVIDVVKYISISSNVFTPNGDGIDDVFSIPCSSAGGLVYDRFGTLVKTLAPGSLVWDGSNNSGGQEPIGLYFIICNGSATPISVTLIR